MGLPKIVTEFVRKLKARSAYPTSKAKGDALERRVANILELEGRRNIRRNVMLTDKNGNKSEIDVMTGYIFRRCYECKHYSSNNPVSLDEVAKFKEVLQLNGLPIRFATFVTTSTFSPRASTIGIKTIDGRQLEAWERSAQRSYFTRRIMRWTLWLASFGVLAVMGAPAYRAYGLPGSTSPHITQLLEYRAKLVATYERVTNAISKMINPPQKLR